MRRKNTNKSQTNFYAEQKILFVSTILLSILAGGCGWENTKATVQSAYVKTEKAVTNTLISIGKYQRDHAYGQGDSGETQSTDDINSKTPAPRPAETPRTVDRFPSRTTTPVEENLRSGQNRQTVRGITQNENSKELPLPPRTIMTLEELRQRIREIERERIRSKNPAERRRLANELKELERMLLTYQKEENIIEEMTQLRSRLRKLQEDLLEIQQSNR